MTSTRAFILISKRFSGGQCLVGLLLFLCAPLSVAASVSISEIAWMGDLESANNEWIEIHNSGNTIAVDGWELSDGMNLTIPLSGTLPSGYSLLERTDDDSAPGAAFLVYTGALTNAGATLDLRDASGTLIDRVAGGENWVGIGGDNTTKETAQYTSAGWVTGVATPGSANAASAAVVEVDEGASETDEGQSDSGSSSGSDPQIQLVLPDHTLSLHVTAPATVYVNQPVYFEVTADGIAETLIKSLRYRWNYGDIATGTGLSPQHAYEYPGTYVVVVEGVYARHTGVARHEITVLPVSFSITRNDQGDIQIHNDAPYEVDLSGYVVGDVGDEYVLPDHTIVVKNGTITIPQSKLGTHRLEPLSLRDAEAGLVALHNPFAEVAGVTDTVQQTTADYPPSALFLSPAVHSFPTTAPPANEIVVISTTSSATKTTFVLPADEAATPNKQIIYLGLVGLIVLIILLIYTKSTNANDEAA